ncbi:peptidoglycan editing factor PgeF [Bdellovibrio bacteriovorus]|uniref:peptidoglycan editing factor PgeF n=1 Tax=Bdellovibrio bacteriovorus TaxID=959 RepID=UPI0035A5EDA7
MNLEQTHLGYELKTPHLTVFFGGINAPLSTLAEAYPQFTLVRLKQIHSDAVVETKDAQLDYQVIADSHYTREKNLALCVITADCVPIFFYHHDLGFIAGAHAGWRGVASRIIPKTIERLKSLGASPEKLEVIIGPHIQKSSFEVGNDVRDQILTSLGPLSIQERALFSEALPESKSLVDLNQVVRTQLLQEGVEMERVFDLHIDTFTNPDFHSHRRDKEKAGRQISFICRTL